VNNRKVIGVLAAVLLVVLLALFLALRERESPPLARTVPTVAERMVWYAEERLVPYYRENGEYPPESFDRTAAELARGALGRKWRYFAATNEEGRRFACILILPWDETFEIKGECFRGENVRKRPIHWEPPECRCATYDETLKNFLNLGPDNDLYLQLIGNKYCVNEMGAAPDGLVTVREIPDLSDPPAFPDSENRDE